MEEISRLWLGTPPDGVELGSDPNALSLAAGHLWFLCRVKMVHEWAVLTSLKLYQLVPLPFAWFRERAGSVLSDPGHKEGRRIGKLVWRLPARYWGNGRKSGPRAVQVETNHNRHPIVPGPVGVVGACPHQSDQQEPNACGGAPLSHSAHVPGPHVGWAALYGPSALRAKPARA